jgi:hypothetical protein
MAQPSKNPCVLMDAGIFLSRFSRDETIKKKRAFLGDRPSPNQPIFLSLI